MKNAVLQLAILLVMVGPALSEGKTVIFLETFTDNQCATKVTRHRWAFQDGCEFDGTHSEKTTCTATASTTTVWRNSNTCLLALFPIAVETPLACSNVSAHALVENMIGQWGIEAAAGSYFKLTCGVSAADYKEIMICSYTDAQCTSAVTQYRSFHSPSICVTMLDPDNESNVTMISMNNGALADGKVANWYYRSIDCSGVAFKTVTMDTETCTPRWPPDTHSSKAWRLAADGLCPGMVAGGTAPVLARALTFAVAMVIIGRDIL